MFAAMGHWVLLGVAIAAEVIATTALKASEGMSKTGPSIIVFVGYGVSFYFLSLALRTLPLSIAYAVWSGVGIALIAFLGWVMFGQRLDTPALVGMGLIVAGVVVINGFSATVRG